MDKEIFNKAKISGISYQQCLQLFIQGEFLRRLSKSGLEDFLMLKGDLFIYMLTNFESRATIDADFLLTGRMKDFYDIYYLAKTFGFAGIKLQTAVFKTLEIFSEKCER